MARDPLDLPWFSPERPATFDGGMKYYEQLLCLKRLIDRVWDYFQQQDIDGLRASLEELWDYVHSQPFEDQIRQTVECWVWENLPCIVTQVCRFFCFGLDDEGHICVAIPTSWEWLNISWDMDYGTPEFGHIKLGW